MTPVGFLSPDLGGFEQDFHKRILPPIRLFLVNIPRRHLPLHVTVRGSGPFVLAQEVSKEKSLPHVGRAVATNVNVESPGTWRLSEDLLLPLIRVRVRWWAVFEIRMMPVAQ